MTNTSLSCRMLMCAGVAAAACGGAVRGQAFITDRDLQQRMAAAQIAEQMVAMEIVGAPDLVEEDVIVPVQRRISDAQITSNIRNALQKPKTGDAAKWRDAAEEAMVAQGDQALAAMRTDLKTRTGIEADVLESAIFRLEHSDLDVQGALREWAIKNLQLDKSSADPATLLAYHHVAGMPALFPHHAFYVIERTDTHAVSLVALAEDGKVQALDDEAARVKMLQREVEVEAETPPAKARGEIARAAAVMGLYRKGLPKAFTVPAISAPRAPDATSSACDATGGGFKVVATVTFNEKNIVTAVKLEASSAPDVATAPAPAPAGRGRRGNPAAPAVVLPPPPPPPPVDAVELE